MTPEWLLPVTDWLDQNPGWLALALVSVAFVESLAVAGLVVPGVALLFAVAALAGQTGMPVLEALAWTALGAIVGDNISFWLGRLFRGRLDSIWPFSRHPHMLERGERFFRQHGGKSVVIGRFVGPIRPVIPLVAGAFDMDGRRFLAFNLGSALAWAPIYVLPGYLVGSTLTRDVELPPHLAGVLVASLLVLAVVYLAFTRLQLALDSTSPAYQWVHAWLARLPRGEQMWHRFTSERTGQRQEFPLASLALALGATALFTLWSVLAVATDLVDPWNARVSAFFLSLRNPLLDPAAIALTLMCDARLLVLVGAMVATLMLIRRHLITAVHVAAAIVLATGLVWLMKQGFAVPRPDLVAQPPGSGAYPSGHATGAAVLFGLAAAVVAREKPAESRWKVYLAFSVPMLMVALSRLYLGVHWFTDVVGGLLLGLAICGLVRASFSRYDSIPFRWDAGTAGGIVTWALLTLGYITVNWSDALARYAPA